MAETGVERRGRCGLFPVAGERERKGIARRRAPSEEAQPRCKLREFAGMRRNLAAQPGLGRQTENFRERG